MNITEHFIIGSDNEITLTLTEDGTAISGAWTGLDIYIGSPAVVTITRTSDGGGVALNTSTGVLTIRVGDLTEDLSALVSGRLYPIWVKLTTATHDDGVDFGGPDSSDQLFFLVTSRP